MSPATSRALPWIAGAVALLGVAGGMYGCSKHGADDRLSDAQAGAASVGPDNMADNAIERAAAVDPQTRCASPATYALLNRELFRRAAQIRGKDDAQFDRIATAASLRVERPVVRSRDEGLGSIACSASVSLDLPPGLAVAGGRASLTADLDYTLQPAADGSGDVVTLTNADAITVPLATIGRTSQPARDPLAPIPVPAPQAPATIPPPLIAPPSSRTPQPPPPPPNGANPSFACARARTAGERFVCSDPGLAAIDRRMAEQYRAAFAAATPDERDELRATGRRFADFRDNCPTMRCIADGYRERMREIDAIMRRDRMGDRL